MGNLRIGIRAASRLSVLSLSLMVALAGCGGSGETIMPDGNLTPEQLQKLNEEDAAIDDSESKGNRPKPKVKK